MLYVQFRVYLLNLIYGKNQIKTIDIVSISGYRYAEVI